MEKRRSKGVTIFAWLMIIVNALMLLVSLDFKSQFAMLQSFSKNFVAATISYALASSLIGVIAGIGLLRLKEIMRKLGVLINIFDLLVGIPLFFLLLGATRQYISRMISVELAASSFRVDAGVVINIIFYSAIFWSFACFALSFLFIFFLTRPKVKEQFR